MERIDLDPGHTYKYEVATHPPSYIIPPLVPLVQTATDIKSGFTASVAGETLVFPPFLNAAGEPVLSESETRGRKKKWKKIRCFFIN
jgi:hypothetical protein